MADALLTSPEQERQTWQYRAVNACLGNRTRVGCVLLSVIGHPPKNPPCFGPSALITPEGDVLSTFVNREGRTTKGAYVGTIDQVRASFNKLADHINATDAERTEMFDQLRAWIAHDYRLLTRRSAQEIEEQGLKGGGIV